MRLMLEELTDQSAHCLPIYHLTLSLLGNFSRSLSFADLKKKTKKLFRKILSGIQSECQTDLTQIRLDVLSSLIWVQSVCKGYEQKTLVDKELITSIDKMSNYFG